MASDLMVRILPDRISHFKVKFAGKGSCVTSVAILIGKAQAVDIELPEEMASLSPLERVPMRLNP